MSKLFENKNERREFLKKATGVLGLGTVLAALAPHDKVFAKMSDKFVLTHVNNTFDQIANSKPNLETDSAYLQTMNNVQRLIENGSNRRVTELYKNIENQLKAESIDIESANADGLLKLPVELRDAVTAGYLSATNSLKYGAFSGSEIQRSLQSAEDLEPVSLVNNETTSRLAELDKKFSLSQNSSNRRASCNGICSVIGIVIVIIIGIVAKNAGRK